MAIFLLKDQVNIKMNAMPAEKAIPNVTGYPEEQPEARPSITSVPTSVPATKPVVKDKSKFKLSQKVFMTVSFLFMIAGLLGVSLMRGSVSATSQSLQDVQQEAQDLKIEKENLTQEVHELSNYTRVVDIAEEQGLDMNEENIRNVE